MKVARLDKRIERARARHELARLIMGTIFLVLNPTHNLVCLRNVNSSLLPSLKDQLNNVLTTPANLSLSPD